ncbi:DMT family transporter [Halarcobacter sp.]|uniref:DMT family transporter n=1 Tax=Halarcobacter sp. TaxID=2321133 RepID=UPI0029F51D5C|nr:DMT family transporter [Halarcobacter sp.]
MNKKLYVLSLILFVILLWAGNFIFIAILLKEIEPFTALTLRFIVISILLFPFMMKLPNFKDFIYLVIATLFIVPGHFVLFFLSIQSTKSLGGISLLIQLSIPFSILLSWIIFKDTPSKLRILGLLIAFVGIVFLLYDPNLLESRKSFILAIFSALFLGLYFIFVKKIKKVKSIAIIAWTSFLGIPMMYLFMLYDNQSFSILSNIQNHITYYSFFYVVIAGSILGHGIWAYLLKIEDISFISPFLLLVPLLTSILSIFVFNEQLTFRFIIIGTIIIIGIFLVFISKQKEKRKINE